MSDKLVLPATPGGRRTLRFGTLLAGTLAAVAVAALVFFAVRPTHADESCDCGNGFEHCRRCNEDTYFNRIARERAGRRPWHGSYYHTMWGQPVALVVPPTAEYQMDYRWGVGGTQVHAIDHQFGRNYPGPYSRSGPYGFLATPPYPSDTRQYGVYYVRGPW